MAHRLFYILQINAFTIYLSLVIKKLHSINTGSEYSVTVLSLQIAFCINYKTPT